MRLLPVGIQILAYSSAFIVGSPALKIYNPMSYIVVLKVFHTLAVLPYLPIDQKKLNVGTKAKSRENSPRSGYQKQRVDDPGQCI